MADHSSKNNEGGLLGKLMFPGYTDAGANDAFESADPTATSERDEKEEESQAATEIRDNRSSIKQQFRANAASKRDRLPGNMQQQQRQQLMTTATTTAGTSSSLIPPSQIANGEIRHAGFFPSTKPQLSPKTPLRKHQSPATESSVSADREAFTFSEDSVDRKKHHRDETASVEKENQEQHYTSQKDGFNIADKKSAIALNAANLKRADDLARRNQSPTDSASTTSLTNRNTSLLNGDNDTSSEALSTASEMGTVIEIGNHAVKMAEIDAMAALIEASPNVDTLTPRTCSPPAPSRTPNRRTDRSDTISNLALPTLDSNQQPSRVMLARHTQALPTTVQPPYDAATKTSTIPATTANPTPSEMLTSALRRIGTGLGKKAKASLSAPPTPRSPGVPATPRVEDLLKATPRSWIQDELAQDISAELPASLALRSPGSSARLSLRKQHLGDESGMRLRPQLSPLPHESSRLQTSQSFDSTMIQPDAPVQKSTQMLKLNPLSPFRLAQQCFSYDSTLENLEEANSSVASASSSHVFNLEASYPMRRTEYAPALRNGIKESISWDVGGGANGAFRQQPHRSHRVGGLRSTVTQMELNAQRLRIYSDFSPSKMGDSQNQRDGVDQKHEQNRILKLRTPERWKVDVEREDALDILACLVERGVTAWNEEGDHSNLPNASTDSVVKSKESFVAELIQEIQQVSENAKDGETQQLASEKIAALEELLKSHAYALEMKRAAKSASTWLRSIGRAELISADHHLKAGSTAGQVGGVQASEADAISDKQSDTSSAISASGSDLKMELLTLKARLHSAENDLKEKSIMNQKLDEELSKCRAEIGRLQTASRNAPSIVQSRSMMDADEEDEDKNNETSLRKNKGRTANAHDGSSSEENKLFDESFQGNNSLFQDDNDDSRTDDNLDLLVLKTALDRANDTIRLLHEKLHEDKSGEDREEAPIVTIPDIGMKSTDLRQDPNANTSTLSNNEDDHRTINVRMLDAENFVTDWDYLTHPLPPPPDHGLNSPIVSAVLGQWTDNQGLHESLLAWMERVMTGDDLENDVPPLTITSLDHQVRDGFLMHVLPLLLRRADIHVEVQTRAHRKTEYDLAVSVNQKRNLASGTQRLNPRSPSLLDQHSNDAYDQLVAAGSGVHSSATVHAENLTARQIETADSEYSQFGNGSEDWDETPQPSFMGALGGALGGLLSRGKYSVAQSPARLQGQSPSSAFHPAMPRSNIDSSNNASLQRPMAELDTTPYHRVVSAPPGRIGITFVEYRGHAMVADMAPDSPLSSWVFPSDILIAVDEVPVSGMRVRDIIKILTNRKDRQRALRVISSHAMNEFTLNQSALGDETP